MKAEVIMERNASAQRIRTDRIRKKSEDYFDKVAATNMKIPEPVRCYECVLDRLEECPGGKLLDIGCGTGIMLADISEKFGERFSLHGLDLSGESLKIAGEKCGGAAELTKGDSENLPYEEGSFDILLCMHSFHHYPHPIKSLREMLRVLVPGGVLFLVENDHAAFRRARKNIRQILLRYPGGDIRMYSQKSLAALVKMAGFTIEKQENIANHSQILVCRK